MTEIKIGKHVIEYYDSIDELPIVRFHKFNKYLLIDAGVGSTMESVDVHLQRISAYLTKDDKKNALAEIQNLRHNIFFVQEEINTKHLAFVALIKSIDGKDISVESEAEIKKVALMLGCWPINEAEETVEAVKKKVDSECSTYFPEFFDSSETKEYYDFLKRNTVLRLNLLGATSEEERKKLREEVEKTDVDLLIFSDPGNFTGKDSAEVKVDKNFDAMCVAISQNAHMDPRGFTTLRFYNVLGTLNEQAKEFNKKHKSKK